METKKIEAFDIETLIHDGKFIPICAVNSWGDTMEEYYGENCIELFIENMRDRKAIFYIHNINFDGLLLIDCMTKRRIKFEIFAVETNIYYLRLGQVEFRCSYKLSPQSLKNIGAKLLGIEKLPYPYKILELKNYDEVCEVTAKHFNSSDEYNRYVQITGSDAFNFKKYTLEYCTRDVVITKNFSLLYMRTMKDIGVTRLQHSYSASSISVNHYFHKYAKK
jgi:hypothetical protein